MQNLSAIQTLACEATWRALQDRNEDYTGQALSQNTPEPEAKRLIRDFVLGTPLVMLPKLVMPQVHKYGGVGNGYTYRWADVCEAGVRFDAHKLAQGNVRASQMQPLVEVSDGSGTQSTSNAHSRTQSGQSGQSDNRVV